MKNWEVKINVNGFEATIMIYGTEKEMRSYIDSELNGRWVKYSAASDEEVEAYKKLRGKIYLA